MSAVEAVEAEETGSELAAGEEVADGGEDALVLDIMLPGRDGLSILKNLRLKGNPVPVILLSARAEPHERVEGLNLGADVYLVKPFYIEELVARLHVGPCG